MLLILNFFIKFINSYKMMLFVIFFGAIMQTNCEAVIQIVLLTAYIPF